MHEQEVVLSVTLVYFFWWVGHLTVQPLIKSLIGTYENTYKR